MSKKQRRMFRLEDELYNFLKIYAEENELASSAADSLRVSIIHFRRSIEEENDGELSADSLSGATISVWEPTAPYRVVARLQGVEPDDMQDCTDTFIQSVIGEEIPSVMAHWKSHCRRYAETGGIL